MQKRARLLLLCLSFGLISCDGVTKWFASNHLRGKAPIELTSTLDLRYVENRDVAFNLLQWLPSSFRRGLILLIGLTMSSVILVLLWRNAVEKGVLGFSLALIFAGAIGNLFDRVYRGFVVDFLHVHLSNYSWPVFNVADICISVGVIMLGISAFFFPEEERAPDDTQTPAEAIPPETPSNPAEPETPQAS